MERTDFAREQDLRVVDLRRVDMLEKARPKVQGPRACVSHTSVAFQLT
jgi:hypothetical protein